MTENLQDPVFDDTTGFRAYKVGLKAGAAAERERILEILDRSKIEWIIHAFDLIDQLMVSKGMETSSEVQDDLRKLADLLGPDAP